MTEVFLVNANASPWNRPGDWVDAGHTVELIGCGGNGGAGKQGVGPFGGSGGGGGGYYGLVYSSGTLGATTPFAVAAAGAATSTSSKDTGATFWEATGTTNSYEAQAGLAGQVGGGFTASGSGVTNGTPSPVLYTATAKAGGSAGAANGAGTVSGGGGGGAGGPDGVGGNGSSSGSSSNLLVAAVVEAQTVAPMGELSRLVLLVPMVEMDLAAQVGVQVAPFSVGQRLLVPVEVVEVVGYLL